jgi:polysaccharide deacetylase 2 family uncharacterized protein YibQ
MRIRLYAIVIVIALAAVAGWYIYHSGMYRTVFARAWSLLRIDSTTTPLKNSYSALENNIRARLDELEIPPSFITDRKTGPDSVPEIRVSIPQGKPMEWIIWRISTATAGTSYDVEDCFCAPDYGKCFIRFISRSSGDRTVLLSLRRSARFFSGSAKMAIIITDFGFSADHLTVEYLSFPHPLTMALLPSRKLSEQTARISSEYQKEVIILLPMEQAGRSTRTPRESLIMVHYPETRIRSIVDNAASTAPLASGFSNFGGNRVLADSHVMEILFSEFKKRRAYFIEFPATKKSVVSAVAQRYSVPVAAVDHNIDTTQTSATIKNALLRFGNEAQKRGFCIVSSPPNGKFLLALKNAQPELSKKGVVMTFVSALFPERTEEKKK